MSELLSTEYQQMVSSAISHAAAMSSESIRSAVGFYTTPSAVYRPRIFIDGDLWCALYGDNLQDGVAGFGKSPALAMTAFDSAWGELK